MMFLNKKLILIGIVAISFLVAQAYSEVVCSEDELVKELIEDIEDNGNFQTKLIIQLIKLIRKTRLLKRVNWT